MRNLLIAVFSTVLLFGCSDEEGQSTESPSMPSANKDSVKILSASPKLNETLKVGATVNIKYEVKYNLASADTGSLTLVVQGASNETLGNELYVIHKGSGTEVLEAEIVVPDTRAIQVFTPLSPQGTSSTTIVESRLYKVER